MGYSRNFGMRSFENIVRDGRFRVPKTGTPFVIGSPVQLDPATPGFLRAADAAAPRSQACGLVLFEHIQAKGVDTFLTTVSDTPFNLVPLGNYAQMIHGAGAKVWFKNTGDKVLYDGRTQEGGALIAGDPADLEIGQGLVPDGAGRLRAATGTEAAWLTIEQINPATSVVEARFEF